MDAMVETLRASAEMNAPPDWSVVPFAVTCARCGHDLHGQTEPTCPACALTFRWSDAVPIEQLQCASCGYHLYGLKDPRCPECGKEFKWDEALANYHRQRKPLFEYQWRTRPVRSLFYTWWLAQRPKKLWTTLDIHDPVHVGPLLFSASVSLCGVMSLVVVLTLVLRFISVVQGTLRSAIFWKSRGFTFTEVLIMDLGWIFDGWQTPVGLVLAGWLVLWLGSLLVSLLIFQQSMHRFKVRPVHVGRITFYACAIGWPGIALAMFAHAGLNLFLPWYYRVEFIGAMIITLAWIGSMRSVAIAYRDYLRMDRPWSVSLAAHVIALMLALVLAIPLIPGGSGVGLLQIVGETIGLF